MGQRVIRQGRTGRDLQDWINIPFPRPFGTPGNASFYADFQNGVYFNSGPDPTLDAATDYSRTGTGTAMELDADWQQFAANVLRRTDAGITIEPANTDELRNSHSGGAVVGTPGTLPTDWAKGSGTPLTQEIVSIGVDDGIEYVDVRYFGTTVDVTGVNIAFNGPTQTVAAQGETWSTAYFAALVGGSLGNVAFVRPELIERQAAGTLIAIRPGTDHRASMGTVLARYGMTFALSDATTGRVSTRLSVGIASGITVDFTLRIGWPYLSKSATIMTPIRNTGTIVGRGADALTLHLPAGFHDVTFTFDNDTTQTVPYLSGDYLVPTNLNRSVIKKIVAVKVPPLEAETAALLARFTTQPTTARRVLINSTIKRLKDAGIWSRLDGFYMLAAPDAQAARLNWIADQYAATLVGAPAFVADRGYIGDNTGANRLSVAFNPTTAVGAQYALNSAHLGTWANTNVAEDSADIGASLSFVRPLRASGTHIAARVNQAATEFSLVPVNTSVGHSIVTRSDAAFITGYRNGIGSAPVAQASGSVDNTAFVMAYGTRQVATAHFGGSLTSTQAELMHLILRDYLDEVDVTNLLARMTVQPSSTRRAQIKTLISTLRRDGVLDKLDALYVLAAHDAQAANLNWIKSSHGITALSGTPTFTADRGYKANLDTDRLNTNYTPSTDGVQFTQDSAHIGVFAIEDVPTPSPGNRDVMGVGSSGPGVWLRIKNTVGNPQAAINTDLGNNSIAGLGTSVGHFMGLRDGASSLKVGRNGVLGSASAVASQGLPSTSLRLLGTYALGAWLGQIGAAHIGAGLTSAQYLALYDALRTYMQAVGAPTP